MYLLFSSVFKAKGKIITAAQFASKHYQEDLIMEDFSQMNKFKFASLYIKQVGKVNKVDKELKDVRKSFPAMRKIRKEVST